MDDMVICDSEAIIYGRVRFQRHAITSFEWEQFAGNHEDMQRFAEEKMYFQFVQEAEQQSKQQHKSVLLHGLWPRGLDTVSFIWKHLDGHVEIRSFTPEQQHERFKQLLEDWRSHHHRLRVVDPDQAND